MQKMARSLILATLVFLTWTGAAAAGELTLGQWPADGWQMWRITFPADGASELRYPQSGTYLTVSYENVLKRGNKLRVEGGLTNGLRGRAGSDTDWDYTHSQNPWYYGEFKTTGASAFANVDFVRQGADGHEFFIGYGYRQNAFRMTEGVYYIENYTAQSPPDTLPGLDSTYTATYQGPHVGVRDRVALSPRVSVVGSLAYSPLTLVQGHGWWNLRSLDFDHSGVGQMVDAYVGLRYALNDSKTAAVTAGYRYQYMSLYNGAESTNGEVTWDKATNVQKGFYVSSEFRF